MSNTYNKRIDALRNFVEGPKKKNEVDPVYYLTEQQITFLNKIKNSYSHLINNHDIKTLEKILTKGEYNQNEKKFLMAVRRTYKNKKGR